MGVPFVIAFEVEVIKPYLKYERMQTLRRLEKLRRPSKGKNLEVVELLSLGLLDEGITIVYPHRNKSNNLHMSQPFQFVNNAWNKRGDGYYHHKTREVYMDRGPPSHCKLCGEVGH